MPELNKTVQLQWRQARIREAARLLGDLLGVSLTVVHCEGGSEIRIPMREAEIVLTVTEATFESR